MALRLRLWDFRLSRLPRVLGLCADDLPRISDYVNAAQRRLLMAKEAGDEGWYGTWAEVAFNVNRERPYITVPREIARLEQINVCTAPVPMYNQFFEYLRFGNGRMPRQCNENCRGPFLGVYQRNNVVTFTAFPSTTQNLSVYLTNDEDVGKRVLLQGTDGNGQTIYNRDVFQLVTGEFVTLVDPSVAAVNSYNSLTGIQKDTTAGQIIIVATDPDTGVETQLHTMEPSETVANYQRYYLEPINNACCRDPDDTDIVPVTAIAKLDLIPVAADTDYCLIQNMEAIIHECQSIRYSEIDTAEAKAMSLSHHKQAIGLLNGELAHFIGKEANAVEFQPFGSARLERLRIGMI